MTVPLVYTWTGEAMEPLGRFQREADRQFVIGQTYFLEEREDRSIASHRHYFVAVKEAWLNLRDRDAGRFKTPDHLRKWALVKAGYRDERSIVCGSNAEALRVATFMGPLDEYAIIVPSERVVTVYTPKSQKTTSMDRKTFQESKDAVLGILADMIEVSPRLLASAGEV